jgi:iron complex outermembrane receptor protein
VVRGPSLLRYGSSAAGGVVNVLDGRIPSEAPEDGLDGKVRLGAATVDESVEAVAGASALLGEGNGFSVVATGALSVRDAQDYEIPGYAESSILRALEEAEHEEEHEGEEHGEDEHDEEKGLLKNSFNEFESASGGLSFIGDRGFLGFSVQSLSNSYGIPGGGHGHGGHDEEEHEEHDEEEHEGEEHEEGHGHGHEGVFIELEQNRFDVNGSLELGGAFERLDIFGGYADYEHTEFEGPGEIGTVFGNEGYEIRAEAIQTPRGNWRGANGVQYRSREFSAIGEEAFVPPTETRQIGIFTVQEWSFGGTIFEAAARYENTEQEDALGGDSQDFDALSASVGVHSDIGGNNHVSASILRTERAPGSEELYSNGPHLATSSFDIGDPTLGTETALGAELGYRFEGDRLRFALTGFYTDYEDFIYQAFTGQTGEDILLAAGEDDEEELEEFGGLDVLRYTAADAVFYGLEFEGSADLGTVGGAAFSADVVADWVDATLDEVDLSGSDQLPRIPPLGIIAGVNAEVGQLDLRFEAEHAAEADETAAFELPTDSFTLLNFYADYDFNETVGVSFSVLNASDEDARLHTSFLKDTVPLPGRNFRFSLNWRF